MNCTGLGALIALRNLARARNGGVRLLNPAPIVQRLFDVVRAGEIFEIVNTRPTDHLRQSVKKVAADVRRRKRDASWP
jgi:anti-anti-sigma regulatory factor